MRNKKKITSTMRWYNLRNQAHPVSTPMNLVHVRVPQELLNPQNTSPHQNGKMIQTPTLGCNWQQQWEVSFIDCRKGSLTVNIWQSSPNKFPWFREMGTPSTWDPKNPTCIQLIPLQLQQEFSTLEDTISYASDTQQRSETTNKKTTHTYPPGTIIKQSPWHQWNGLHHRILLHEKNSARRKYTQRNPFFSLPPPVGE